MVVLIPSKLETRAVFSEAFHGCLIEQVVDFLLVNLEIRTVNCKLLLLQVRLLPDQVKQVMNRARDQTISVHTLTRWSPIKMAEVS
jgi:hypothetical protein